MNRTLRISFSLKNTYRVNSILYAVKQIPLIKKLLPDSLYRIRGLKVFANVLSVLWAFVSAFAGKFLYLLLMIAGACSLYGAVQTDRLFLHILVFLTIAGAFTNTYMFNPTRDKYYAMILMRMDAKSYTLANYGLAILKVVIGFLPFAFIFGRANGVPMWICLMIPFYVAGLKLFYAACILYIYEKRGKAVNENGLNKMAWTAILIILALAYGLPAVGILIPTAVSVAVFGISIAAGAVSLRKILSFDRYREMYQELLYKSLVQMDDAAAITRKLSQKSISTDTQITSSKKGFEYLNEIFVKRHQKILWKSVKQIAVICLALLCAVLLIFYLQPSVKEEVNKLLMTFLPYFVFIMYAINRGTGFTKALFMNCDHSLLTYAFYKQPKLVLKLFRIRLREIIKINLLPASIIGTGLAVLLYASGGTDNPLNYAVLLVSILCMSVFFSVHYLTIYYLLQPYNAGTEMKSGTYQIVLSVTYLVCFFMMQVEMPIFIFGIMTIAFCVIYCIAACILVYRFAPRTFRLRT